MIKLDQEFNGIIINDIIKKDIREVVDYKPAYTTYDILNVLERYLQPNQVMDLLDIGRTSYYKFKREKKLKYIDRKIYALILSLEY